MYEWVLSKVFYYADYGGRDEEELDGVADGGHHAAAGQLCSTFNPEPARRHGVGPADDTHNESNNSGHSSKDECQRIRVFEQVKASDEKCDGAYKLKKPEKY